MGRKRIHPPISFHRTLSKKIEVNWDEQYNNEFHCPYCGDRLTRYLRDKSGCKLVLNCFSCKKRISLTVPLPFYPISIHRTLRGELRIDWKQEYHNEFNCPYCQIGKLEKFHHSKSTISKLGAMCDSCGKKISLTCTYAHSIPKHNSVSTHQTLKGQLKVDWKKDYKGEFLCPNCSQQWLTNLRSSPKSIHNLNFKCSSCNRKTSLSLPIQAHVRNYLPDVSCPNPACNKNGLNGQKGWVYERSDDSYICHYCNICFNPKSKYHSSWIQSQNNEIRSFNFDDNQWDLRNFYDQPRQKVVNLQTINPIWYRLQAKKYLYYLLKSHVYESGTVENIITCLRQFGNTLRQLNILSMDYIDRRTIIFFLDTQKRKASKTINNRLSYLKNFLEWLEIDTIHLIKSRDFLKISKNDSSWLDEVTRKSIKQNLEKIPPPIACHYLVQEYIAGRSGDVCLLNFDCLVEENGKWYINFYQQKIARWHKILASRKIRKVIEKQQQWIRTTFHTDYPYLFCHFRNISHKYYPAFPNLRPLSEPPRVRAFANPMVKIIRILIEKENVLDINGQKPHFTGKITRSSRLQEIRTRYGMEAAQLYADHKSSRTTLKHYAAPTREQIAEVDLPFQELLINPDNKFLPWQSLPESLLKNPKAHELDIEIAPRLVVYGHCALDPKKPCPIDLFPKCYGCNSFRPSTAKLPLYERQYEGEQKRLVDAEKAGESGELAFEEAKATIEAMDKWLPELRRLADG